MILAIFPADFKHNPAYWRAFTLGIVMLVLATTQLFQFEDFPGVITAMGLPGGVVAAGILAALLPLFEIASLPYLLSMKITQRVRSMCMWSAAVAAGLWVLLTLQTNLTAGMSAQSGIFGATLATRSGWWSVIFAVLLLWSVALTMRELPPRRVK